MAIKFENSRHGLMCMSELCLIIITHFNQLINTYIRPIIHRTVLIEINSDIVLDTYLDFISIGRTSTSDRAVVI